MRKGGNKPVSYEQLSVSGGQQVFMHPSSVNSKRGTGEAGKARDGFYVYEVKVDTSRLFVRETTRVTPYALLLFGAKAEEISIEKVTQTGCVELAAAGIKLRTERDTAMLMKLLQQELARLFLMKAKDPSADIGQRGGAVISTVVTLLDRSC